MTTDTDDGGKIAAGTGGARVADAEPTKAKKEPRRRKGASAQTGNRVPTKAAPGKDRAVPLRQELAVVCGNPIEALVLQQVQYLQQRHLEKDQEERAAYIEEEELRASMFPPVPQAFARGWFKRSVRELAEDLFGMWSETALRDAMDRLRKKGIVHRRQGRGNRFHRAMELRLDLVRLAELLAKVGRLPETRWFELGIVFPTEWSLAPAGHPDLKSAPRHSTPAGDRSAPDADVDSRHTQINIQTETVISHIENPLPPGGESSSSSFDPSSFDPADVAQWQAESTALLPTRCSGQASMDFVRQAPVARIFPALYRRFPGWTPALARSFAKRVKNGRVTVARLLACLLARTPVLEPMRFLNDEFPCEGMTERVHFLEERAIVAEKVLLAQPDARDLLGDLAQEADQWREREERSLAMSEHTILEKHPVDGLLEHNGFSQIQHRDALLLSIARLHPSMVLPVETSDADRVRESILESCAVSGRIREVVLEMDPEFLRIRVGLTPDDILQRANGHRDNLFRQWARWLAVSAALR